MLSPKQRDRRDQINKGERDLDRLELIQEILCANIQASAMTMRFLGKVRIYTENDELYMSEMHFIVEAGSMDRPTMSELAHRLKVTQGAVTQTAARLEKKGYIIRIKEPSDKRVNRIVLTKLGEILREEHIKYDQHEYLAVSEYLKDFTDDDLEKVLRYEKIMEEIFRRKL